MGVRHPTTIAARMLSQLRILSPLADPGSPHRVEVAVYGVLTKNE